MGCVGDVEFDAAAVQAPAARRESSPVSESHPVAPRPRLGTVLALSGPLRSSGEAILAGLRAGLEEGVGIGQAPFELIVRDDGYEPVQTASLVEGLGADPLVLGLVACLGTPTAIAGLPIAAEHGLAWCAGFSGAEVLRQPVPPAVAANFRASYHDEVRAMVRGLVGEGGLSGAEIGFFTQRDGFGDDGFRTGVQELSELSGIEPGDVAYARYDRELGVVSKGLAYLLRERAPKRAMIVIGHCRVMADLIRLADREGYRPLWCGVSFTEPQLVLEELGELAEGVVFTAVVDAKAEQRARRDGFRAGVDAPQESSLLAFEAYLVGAALRRDAELRGAPRSRREFAERVRGLADELQRERRGGLGAVWPTVVRGGRLVPLQWSELRGSAR